jgi:hypothetical protein
MRARDPPDSAALVGDHQALGGADLADEDAGRLDRHVQGRVHDHFRRRRSDPGGAVGTGGRLGRSFDENVLAGLGDDLQAYAVEVKAHDLGARQAPGFRRLDGWAVEPVGGQVGPGWRRVERVEAIGNDARNADQAQSEIDCQARAGCAADPNRTSSHGRMV